MNVTLSLASVAGLIQATLCLFLAALLFRSKKPGHLWLAGFVVSLGINFLLAVVARSTVDSSWYGLVNWLFWSVFAAMPMLFLYCQTITLGYVKNAWLHFLPVVLFLGFEALAPALIGASRTFAITNVVFQWALPLQVIGYAFLVNRLSIMFRKRQELSFSSFEGRSLRWLQVLVIVEVILTLSDALILPSLVKVGVSIDDAEMGLNFASTLYILWLCTHALSQHFDIEGPEVSQKPAKNNGRAAAYRSSSLDGDTIGNIASDIERAVVDGQLYLDSSLTLNELARSVGLNKHIVSEVLNRGMGKNFYEYINGHRIEWAKAKLLGSDAPVMEIALDAGFNNKATFNQFFKRLCNVTPTQFRKNGGIG